MGRWQADILCLRFVDKVDKQDDVLAAETNTQSSAVEGLEAKVGVDSSSVVTSHDYILQILDAATIGAALNDYVIVIDDTVVPRGIKWAANPIGLADPTTTRGDMIYRNASTTTRIAVGSVGQFLKSNGTDPVWDDLPATTTSDILEQQVFS